MPCARGTKARYRKEAFVELEQRAKQRREERAARLEVKSGYIGNKIFEAEYVNKAFDVPTADGSIIKKVILKDFYYNFSLFTIAQLLPIPCIRNSFQESPLYYPLL